MDQGYEGVPRGFITIAAALREGCEGGVFFVDGEAWGSYPVERCPVPAGDRRIHIESAEDCGGYATFEVRIVAGQTRVLE